MIQKTRDNMEKAHILIVEDSPTQATQLTYILEEEGYLVNWVTNGKEALRFVHDHKPSIVITDVLMPEMDGFELCSQLKKDETSRHIPIILLTTLSEPGDIIRGLACEADNFITKPYNRDYLLSRLNYLLANLELRQATQDRSTEIGIEIFFGGQKHRITSERMQIIDLLISTYDAVVQKNAELERMNQQLQEVNEKVRTLKGIIPICANCKKIRNDEGYWQQVESYISSHTEADFSHGICPDCTRMLYPDLMDDM